MGKPACLPNCRFERFFEMVDILVNNFVLLFSDDYQSSLLNFRGVTPRILGEWFMTPMANLSLLHIQLDYFSLSGGLDLNFSPRPTPVPPTLKPQP